MIAKGNLHAHGAKLAAYLTTSSENERAELVELRGFAAATNIRDAFIDVQMQAEGTKALKPFFHAYVRVPEGERLSRETWLAVADRLEHELGFDGQPRAVAFHCQAGGESHMHVAWSRIHLETMRALDPGLYKVKMKQLCREFEQEHGLTRVSNERRDDQKTRAADRGEFEQARRLGSDLKDIRNTIHDCWEKADNGKAFAAALAEQGMILSRGDRRPFVIIDRHGGDHALSKRITGATAAETRARLADIERDSLPSVAAAKATQRERFGKVTRRQPRARTSLPRDQAPTISPRARASIVTTSAPIRLIGGVLPRAARQARPAGGLVKTAGKLAEGVANALEGLLGGASSRAAPADDKRPLDVGPRPTEKEIDQARQFAEADKAQRRQRFLRDFSREVPDERQQDAEIERGKGGRERER